MFLANPVNIILNLPDILFYLFRLSFLIKVIYHGYMFFKVMPLASHLFYRLFQPFCLFLLHTVLGLQNTLFSLDARILYLLIK